ncbi:hypothetical protein AXF42_Ash000871 [Apostasia shenzhenica]|uniref:Uncharacterized protein n=1 Tax=Apostasia shenzhenica TaxID=1088818 RepID=A0A2I0ATA1_9ASPA|nr:hypothetical protein AXF42_Ash000871 [Apostasia shenzhenica]
MYAIVHHRPQNLDFIIFSWICSRHVPLHNDRVFMPYCHFITAYLEFFRIDIFKGAIKKIGKSAKVGRGNMIQVELNVNISPLTWADGKGLEGAPQDELEADAEETDIDRPGPSHAPHYHQPTYSHLDTLIAIRELQSQFGEFRVEVRDHMHSMETRLMADMQRMTDHFSQQFGWPPFQVFSPPEHHYFSSGAPHDHEHDSEQ